METMVCRQQKRYIVLQDSAKVPSCPTHIHRYPFHIRNLPPHAANGNLVSKRMGVEEVLTDEIQMGRLDIATATCGDTWKRKDENKLTSVDRKHAENRNILEGNNNNARAASQCSMQLSQKRLTVTVVEKPLESPCVVVARHARSDSKKAVEAGRAGLNVGTLSSHLMGPWLRPPDRHRRHRFIWPLRRWIRCEMSD